MPTRYGWDGVRVSRLFLDGPQRREAPGRHCGRHGTCSSCNTSRKAITAAFISLDAKRITDARGAYFRSSLASFAKFAAIRRASSFLSCLAADRQPGFSSK